MNKKKNIGGAFALLDTDQFISENRGDYNIFFPDEINGSKRILFETGIDSLAYIIKSIVKENQQISQLFFPLHYCGDSIERLCFKVEGLEIIRYKNIDELIDIHSTSIVIWNHFNKFQEVPEKLFKMNIILIEDFVHAPFDMIKAKAKYSINSLRKVGNHELSVCYAESNGKVETSSNISIYYLAKKKAETTKHYFQKTTEVDLEKIFLQEFKESEEGMNSRNITQIYQANTVELSKFYHTDFQSVLSIRTENYLHIHKMLSESNKLQIVDGGYMYLMLRSEKRDQLKTQLAKNGVFTTIHWIDSSDTEKANTYISIYIDQRFTFKELDVVANLISAF